MSLLEVQNLKVSFPMYGAWLQAVRGVSFSVEEGEAVGIVGESGCGKSALAQAITRLIPHAKIEGKIVFDKKNLLEQNEKEIRRIRGKQIGMVFQDPMSALNPTMTIGSQIEEALACHHMPQGNKALELLKEVKISQPEDRLKQYPHQLSGGMRQRVLISIAIACHPRLLIADEPTTALDTSTQHQILKLFQSRKNNASLILITHDLHIVSQMCDRILVMYGGKIVETDFTQKILKHPRHPYTQLLLRSRPQFDQTRSEPIHAIEGTPPNLLVPPHGCPFAERCPRAWPICSKEEPPFVDSAACWNPISKEVS